MACDETYRVRLTPKRWRRRAPQPLRYPGFKRSRSVRGARWERGGVDEGELEVLRRRARADGIRIEAWSERYERSAGYRKAYIEKNPGPWRCRYCHRLLRRESDMTVDHIVPVAAVSGPARACQAISRAALDLEGARSVNDEANLCPACRRCNSRKGSKVGAWTLRGWLGRYRAWWIALRAAQGALLAAAIWALWRFGPDALSALRAALRMRMG